MTTRILIPLDGSSLAEQTLPCALTLGQQLPDEVVLFHAVSVPPETKERLDSAALEAGALTEEIEIEARAYLRGIASELHGAGLTVRQAIRRGPPLEAIVDYGAERNIQKIVMTTHGRTGISRWKHGSVAERVVRSATAPVLLVRAEEKALGTPRAAVAIRRILVPLDGSTVSEQFLPRATATAQALSAEITLCQVPIIHVTGSLSGEWYLPIQGVLETAKQDAQAYLDRIPPSTRGLQWHTYTSATGAIKASNKGAHNVQVLTRRAAATGLPLCPVRGPGCCSGGRLW